MKKINIERNKVILTIIDILIIAFSCVSSRILLMNTYTLMLEDWMILERSIILSVLVYQTVFRVFSVYRNITRYENGEDYLIYIIASAISCGILVAERRIFAPYFTLLRVKEFMLSSFMIMVFAISYRVIIRAILTSSVLKPSEPADKEKMTNLLIIGAGSAARDIIKILKGSLKNKYNIVGLIDDNPFKGHYSISGVRILGSRNDIERICKKYNVQEIFFTITNIDAKNKREIFSLCQNTTAKLRTLPSTEDIIKNKNLLENMKDVEIEDLLGREPISLDNNNIENLIKDNVVLVTGGGGSIGSELCRQIITYHPKKLVILDIYENNLYDIQTELKFKYEDANIEAIVGSVRDKKKLDSIFKKYRPALVFHAAAHKHVPLMEDSPLEAIKNNVLGTKNVADCADEYGTKRFILISTDKAVNPTNIMGASKRLCEMIIQAKNQVSKTEYAAVRFGNVLGSNGSVIPLFKKQIKEGGPVTVTHKEITRFFMTIPEAVGLVLQAMTYAKGGEIFVLDMGKPVKIYDLAVSLIKLSGLVPDVDIPIEITGLRPGEKLYEELLIEEEGLINTDHKKIFISKLLEINPQIVLQTVDKLKEFASSEEHSTEEIKYIMKQAVPTYKEPDEINEEAIKRIEEKKQQQEKEALIEKPENRIQKVNNAYKKVKKINKKNKEKATV